MKCHPIDPATSNERLMTHVGPVKNFVCNIYLLRFYQKMGYKVTKVHKALRFKQRAIFRDFIDMVIKERNLAKSSGDAVLSQIYKLVSNSLFGKCGQNVKNNHNYKFAFDQKSAWKLSVNPLSKGFSTFNENVSGCLMMKDKIVLNKPQYLLPSILDLSKLHMLKFHYDVMKKHFGDRAYMIYTDTDSLIYEILCEDLYAELSHEDINPYIDTTNSTEIKPNETKTLSGLFKLEHEADETLEEFFCSGLKTYSLKVCGKDKWKCATKGFEMPHTAETHEKFRQICEGEVDRTRVERTRIASKGHNVQQVTAERKGLERTMNGKRYAYVNENDEFLHSLPYGLSQQSYKELQTCQK